MLSPLKGDMSVEKPVSMLDALLRMKSINSARILMEGQTVRVLDIIHGVYAASFSLADRIALRLRSRLVEMASLQQLCV